MRETNPPSNPRLLDALARHFADNGYDLKDLIRTICRSGVYQLRSEPNEYNARDVQSFSHHYPRRLQAEVLLDAIDQVNGTQTVFAGMPAGARAVQLPDMGGVDSYFLKVFGRPLGASACECERTGDTSLAQTLQLLNSAELYDKLGAGRAKALAAATRGAGPEGAGPEGAGPEGAGPEEAGVRDLYYAAFSRPPTPSESAAALAYLRRPQVKEAKDVQAAWEDLLWAVINTKEFLFNH